MNTFQTVPNKKGLLSLTATPLGNEKDLTPRAIEALENADIVLAEDTKRAGLNLARWGIKPKKLVAFHEHNEKEKTPQILKELAEGKHFALISDAGMPVISDPGYTLVKECRQNDIEITVIPGASAPLCALAASGIPPLPFAFLGFLPRTQGDIEKTLTPYAFLPLTLIFFERKDRLYETLCICKKILGNRQVCVARELTKIHEEFINFDLNVLEAEEKRLTALLGEITVVLGHSQTQKISSEEEIDALITKEKAFATSPKDLAKKVQSLSFGWQIKDIYRRLK